MPKPTSSKTVMASGGLGRLRSGFPTLWKMKRIRVCVARNSANQPRGNSGAIEVDTKTKGVQWRAATELRMEDRRQDSLHHPYDMTTLAVPWTWNTS
jgi:hypothetical protein